MRPGDEVFFKDIPVMHLFCEVGEDLCPENYAVKILPIPKRNFSDFEINYVGYDNGDYYSHDPHDKVVYAGIIMAIQAPPKEDPIWDELIKR